MGLDHPNKKYILLVPIIEDRRPKRLEEYYNDFNRSRSMKGSLMEV